MPKGEGEGGYWRRGGDRRDEAEPEGRDGRGDLIKRFEMQNYISGYHVKIEGKAAF